MIHSHRATLSGLLVTMLAALKTEKAYISAWMEEMKMPTVGQ